MFRSPRVLLGLFLLAAACGRGQQADVEEASKLASFTIGDYQPESSMPQWTALKLNMEQVAPNKSQLEKKFGKADFAQGKAEDLNLSVPYGSYKILLSYSDATGKDIYRSCEDEQSKLHEINQPSYEAKIALCMDGKPAGTVEIEKSSSVVITPMPPVTTPTPETPTVPVPPIGGTGELGSRLLIGYWHNWNLPSAKFIRLREVSPAWDIIQIAFAEPAAPGSGRMAFTPDAQLTSVEQFKEDVKYLRGLGKKVLISIGGANSHVDLKTVQMKNEFVESMASIINTYGFDGLDLDLEGGSFTLAPGDTDFKNPSTPGVKNMITAVRELQSKFGSKFVLTMAPETAYVQGGYANYVGIWGAYLPVIHGLRDILNVLHVQHYNTGSILALDDKAYSQGTADFHVAMTEMMLAGFPVGRNPNAMFPGLRPDQVAIGLPSVAGAAPAGGFTSVADVQKAFLYLAKGQSYSGEYKLRKADGYAGLRGLMTWSINWDAAGNFEFSKNHRQLLDRL